jgi:HlyD family secretion protein
MSAAAEPQPSLELKLVVPSNLNGASRRRRFLWIGVAAGLAGVAVISSLFLLRPTATAYRSEPVSRRTIMRQVEALGHLDVPERIEVPAPAAGRIAEILVAPGQLVHRGELLAQLDETAANFALGAARGSLEVGDSRIAEARVSLEAAVDGRSRTERLAARGLASDADLRTARAAEAKARTALRGARAERAITAGAVASARVQKALTAIRAPVDAVVLAAPERVGTAVSPEIGRLFVLGSTMDVMRIRVSVAEADVAEVKPGQSASFSVPAFPGRTFAARVVHVTPEAQRERSAVTYEVTLEAANRPPLLFPGMTADVRIGVARADNVLAVREAALRFAPPRMESRPDDAPRSRVWRIRGPGRLEPISVLPGISDGAYTEIRAQGQETIAAGDAVAIGMGSPEEPRRNGPGVSLGKR